MQCQGSFASDDRYFCFLFNVLYMTNLNTEVCVYVWRSGLLGLSMFGCSICDLNLVQLCAAMHFDCKERLR